MIDTEHQQGHHGPRLCSVAWLLLYAVPAVEGCRCAVRCLLRVVTCVQQLLLPAAEPMIGSEQQQGRNAC
jgi:hypothetical protein